MDVRTVGPYLDRSGHPWLLVSVSIYVIFAFPKKDILESSVSSPLVDEEPNSAGDSPHLDAPL